MSNPNQNQNPNPNKSKQRLLSTDALRGMDMFWIIGAEGLFAALFLITGWPIMETFAKQMLHSPWHGFTAYDLIFPLFIFLAGVSLGLSAKQLTHLPMTERHPIYKKAFKRLGLLCLLGIFYNHGWGTGIPADVDGVRYASVLGRIGFAWFFAALIVWHFNLKGQIAWAVGILIGYWALLALVTIGEYGGGNYGETHSLNAWVDQALLPGIRYRDLPVDPEGILSTFPAIVNCLLGVVAGRALKAYQGQVKRILTYLVGGGIACLVVGWVWHLGFPVNKTLWTSSFVLVTTGWSLLLLALFYLLCDVLEWKKVMKPFLLIGVNSIAIYMASSLFNWGYVVKSLFGGFIAAFPDVWQPLFTVIGLLVVQLIVLGFMYRHKILIKI